MKSRSFAPFTWSLAVLACGLLSCTTAQPGGQGSGGNKGSGGATSSGGVTGTGGTTSSGGYLNNGTVFRIDLSGGMSPVIDCQPQSRVNLVGSTPSFGVTAIGTLPLTCQWRKNDVNLANGVVVAVCHI